LARALESRGEKTLVIATVDVGSPWRSLAEKIPNLEMIELHKELHGMGQDQIMRFCLNVVRGWSVSRISVINSEVGYRLAAETKSLLKQLGCRLYLHTYAYDMTEDGYIFNMIPNGIVKAYPGVDEIFAVASQEDSVSRSFFAGLSTLPYIGWAVGTLIGAILGSILPDRLMSALSLAIYGMFVAIVVPEMKKSRAVVFVVLLALVLSCMFYYVPFLSRISSGITITVVAIVAAVIGSLLFPVADDTDKE
jgi:hypothetical protein